MREVIERARENVKKGMELISKLDKQFKDKNIKKKCEDDNIKKWHKNGDFEYINVVTKKKDMIHKCECGSTYEQKVC